MTSDTKGIVSNAARGTKINIASATIYDGVKAKRNIEMCILTINAQMTTMKQNINITKERITSSQVPCFQPVFKAAFCYEGRK